MSVIPTLRRIARRLTVAVAGVLGARLNWSWWREVERGLWQRWFWRSWRVPSALEVEASRILERCGELHHRWLVLADHGRTIGVDYDDDNGAGHLAYLDYEAECHRLSVIAIKEPRPYGWLSGAGGLTCCVENWGGLATLGGYNKNASWPRVRPVTRWQAYLAMGWVWEPEPTEEEHAAMTHLFAAMRRIDTEPWTERSGDGRFTSVLLGKEYFTELVANLREAEARATPEEP